MTVSCHQVVSVSPNPGTDDSETTALIRTLRYHYLFKVYIPMYRLIHLQSRRNDREEIRRKLAMAGPDEEYYGGERSYKKPNLQTRLQSGMNLQICFMNEATAEQDRGGSGGKANSHPATEGEQPPNGTAKSKEQEPPQPPPRGPGSTDTASPPGGSDVVEDEDFFTKQAKLQAEARMALAQVRPMAHMQLEVEKQIRKKSPIAEITGIPGFGDGKRRKLRHQLLGQMNLAQLQVVVNDLHAQIEGLNEELVRLLVERDDLHMEQDSMLVDIEDLTRYCLDGHKKQSCSLKVEAVDVKKTKPKRK